MKRNTTKTESKDPSSSKWPVIDQNGSHVGSIIRQPGTTLWCLQRKGMDRPFKRNIPTLDAAKKLAESNPSVWKGSNFILRDAATSFTIWIVLLGCSFALLIYG